MPGFYLNPIEVDSVNDLTISTGAPYSFSSPELGIEDIMVRISYLITEVSSDGLCDYGDSGDNNIFSTEDEDDIDSILNLTFEIRPTYYDITIRRLGFGLQTL